MTEPNREAVEEILSELDDLPFIPGAINGEKKDPNLIWVPVMGISDKRLGALLRGMGAVTARYVQAEHTEHLPPMINWEEATEDSLAAHRRQSSKFTDRMRIVKVFAGDKIREIISDASMDPSRTALYNKTVIFGQDEPLLYFEHWRTDDLGEPDRDPVEIPMLVGLNDYAKTGIGNFTAHGVLKRIVGDYGMSRSSIPDRDHTFGTINPQLFEPFVRPTEAE